MDISRYATHEKVGNVDEIRSTSRQGLLPLIWIRQTRHGVGCLIAKLATDAIQSRSEISKSQEWCNLYNTKVRPIRRHQSKIHYKPDPESPEKCQLAHQMTDYRITSSADSGFASSEGAHSIESNVVIFGRIFFGAVWFTAMYISWIIGARQSKGRAGHRCRRNVAPLSRPGIFSCGIKYWRLGYSRIRTKYADYFSVTDFPMMSPFVDSPSEGKLKVGKLFSERAREFMESGSETKTRRHPLELQQM